MRLGIIGLPQTGKTTIFNAVTRGDIPTGISAGRFRLIPPLWMCRIRGWINFRPCLIRKRPSMPRSPTWISLVWMAVPVRVASRVALLNQLTQMDGFIHVLRCFEDDNVPHQEGSVDPVRDLHMMDSEFIINDLIFVERKLERLADERRKGAGRDKASIDRDIQLFEKMQTALNEEIPLRDMGMSDDEIASLSGFGFLTLKPVMLLLNLAEGKTAPKMDYPHQHSLVVDLQGKLEMDMAKLSPEDAEMFMQEYGIEELSLNRMIKYSYDLLVAALLFYRGSR